MQNCLPPPSSFTHIEMLKKFLFIQRKKNMTWTQKKKRSISTTMVDFIHTYYFNICCCIFIFLTWLFKIAEYCFTLNYFFKCLFQIYSQGFLYPFFIWIKKHQGKLKYFLKCQKKIIFLFPCLRSETSWKQKREKYNAKKWNKKKRKRETKEGRKENLNAKFEWK